MELTPPHKYISVSSPIRPLVRLLCLLYYMKECSLQHVVSTTLHTALLGRRLRIKLRAAYLHPYRDTCPNLPSELRASELSRLPHSIQSSVCALCSPAYLPAGA